MSETALRGRPLPHEFHCCAQANLLFATSNATLLVGLSAVRGCEDLICSHSRVWNAFLTRNILMPTVHRLPSRFPVGTRYVIEGEPDRDGELRITSRYLVFPNGTHLDLRVDDMSGPEGPRHVRVRRTRGYNPRATKRWPAV
jgi:hypothetical protein